MDNLQNLLTILIHIGCEKNCQYRPLFRESEIKAIFSTLYKKVPVRTNSLIPVLDILVGCDHFPDKPVAHYIAVVQIHHAYTFHALENK